MSTTWVISSRQSGCLGGGFRVAVSAADNETKNPSEYC